MWEGGPQYVVFVLCPLVHEQMPALSEIGKNNYESRDSQASFADDGRYVQLADEAHGEDAKTES